MITITGGQMPLSGGTLTGPLAIAVGSAAAPGLAVAGDANTGLWAPAADTLAVATAGVERLRVSSGGYVGIGTTTPVEKLDVAGSIRLSASSTTFPTMSINTSGGFNFDAPSGGGVADSGALLILKNSGALKFTILGNSNVGIGITTPTAALHVPASSTARASLRVPDGTAPTAPNTGDVWAAGGKLYYYNGATTKEIAFV